MILASDRAAANFAFSTGRYPNAPIMSSGFPKRFSLGEMAGASGRAFEDRSDAFQQLIGDGLLAMSGHQAHSYPTKGEDGCIDSFLATGASLIRPFVPLPLPAIVECKDHDDSLSGVGGNILSGWDKVRGKLKRQSEKGWPDLFRPWREAKAYVYIVSARIPAEDIRRTLTRRIEKFFEQLPTEQRPPVERIVVLDWTDARLWLDRFPNLRDSWLGTGASNILSLNQYRVGLTGFRRFLRSDELRYRPPAIHSPHHPEVLFGHLSDPATNTGILLVGAGGVGKTRTSYEVALLAEQNRWRILYVLPTDPPVTTEQLSAVILAHRSVPTLVVFEYLDQMPHLDVGALRRCVIPRAADNGTHVACLANSRPGFVWKPHPERDELFRRVDLSLTNEEARSLSQWAVKQTAPRACDVLSEQEVFRVCGRRPIIALLVAQQLEKLALAGLLSAEAVRPVREDDPLGHWLRRRLAEDHLTSPQPMTVWEIARPPAHVVAAAAVLASAPDTVEGLVDAGGFALQALQNDPAGQRMMAVLRDLGWIERDGLWLSAVHDVVADEVVEQSIFDGSLVRRRELEAMLSVATSRARSFGRLAKALSRVQGATTPERSIELRNASREWLSRHANAIGDMIAKEAPTHGSYALGAVFGGSPLEEPAIEHWSALVAPWLEKYDTDFEARHLLYRGLRAVSGDAVVKLVAVALKWLSRWRLENAASFVIAPLLHYRALSIEDFDLLIPWAVEWLERYGANEEAEFVLGALLSRKDLKEPEASKAIAHGMTWLESHGSTESANFVLGPLLARKDVKEPEASKVIGHAMTWLESHGPRESAAFVLSALLARKDVKEPAVGKAIGHAMSWLESHVSMEAARFVLGPLLSRMDVKEPEAGKAIRHALTWLKSCGASEGARIVVEPLLRHKDLRESAADKITSAAKDWLVNHASNLGAERMLREWLDSGRSVTDVRDIIVEWLKAHKGYADVDYVCSAWVESGGEPAAVREAVVDWLSKYGAEARASHLYRAWIDADGDKAAIWSCLLNWLQQHRSDQDAVYVTKYIAKQRSLPVNTIRDLLAWCSAFPFHEEVLWRFTSLERNLLTEGIACDVVHAARIVLPCWINWQADLNQTTRFQINTLMGYLLVLTDPSSSRDKDAVDDLYLVWLRNPNSFGENTRINPFSQRKTFLARLLVLLDAAYLSTIEDEESLKRLARWVNAWDAKAKQHIISILREIQERHAAPWIWDIVQMPRTSGGDMD